MKTIVVKTDAENPNACMIEEAARILRGGGLVAFPTETVYGLGANGLSRAACKKIYEAKGRPSDNPLILHISHISDLEEIVKEIPDKAKKVMSAFWPGPITLIFKKAECVPDEITGGFDTVAVRFPNHKLAQLLIEKAGVPIAAPSANSSGKPSPTRASHVAYDLDGRIDMIIDGGPANVGLESTILDLTGDIPVILRPGAITKEMIEEIIGKIEIDPAVLKKPEVDLAPKAPGMKYIHYSPKADVTLVKGNLDFVVSKINSLTECDMKKGLSVGIMATEQTKNSYCFGTVLSVGDRNHIDTVGSNLFKVLRYFDFLGIDVVYSEVFEEQGEGVAIMNRLSKAAGYKIIE